MPGPGDRGGEKRKPKNAKRTLARIIKYMAVYKWVVVALVLLAFLSNIGNLMGPRLAGKAIGVVEEGAKLNRDTGTSGNVDMEKVTYYAALMLIFYVGSTVLSFLVGIGMARVGRRIANHMRRDVFHKLMVMPVSYFDRNQAGDIISRVSYDVDVVTMSLSSDVVQIITSFVTVVRV